MSRFDFRPDAYSRLRLITFLVFLAACFLGGGGSRSDIHSLIYVRPVAVMCLMLLLLTPGPLDLKSIRTPLALLAAFALVAIAQLVPLPPEIWSQLPGHERFAVAAVAAGIEQPWRPLSVSPDLTLNSLVAMVVPLTALVGMASLRREDAQKLLPILIAGALISALVAVIQLATGALYFYEQTNQDSGVGLFANRNHQAVLLACAIPMLAIWAVLPQRNRAATVTRVWVAAAAAVFLLLMILVTGSRAGLVLGAGAFLFAWLQVRNSGVRIWSERRRGWRRLLPYLPGLVILAVLLAAVALSRAEALQRLFANEGVAGELRVWGLPIFLQMAQDFFPFGSGLGTLDPLFRIYEPHHALQPAYVNHAHNDLIELLINGGVPALLLLVGLLLWWGRRSFAAFRPSPAFSLRTSLARLGSVIILMLLLASLVDYPLRTPLLSAFFAIAAGWLCQARPGGRVRPAPGGDHDFSLPSSR